MLRIQKIISFALLSILLAALLIPVAAQAQTKTLYWERLDVNLTVLDSGDLLVEETQVIVFTSGTFREGYRSIPDNRLGSISAVSVWEDGQSCRVSVDHSDGQYEIVWDLLQPRSNSRHTYVLQYTVHGALRYYDDGDQLWWKAIFSDRSFPVYASTVTVNLPAGAAAEQAEAYGTDADYAGVGGTRVVFTALEQIDPGQELEVRIQFPHGVVSGSAAAWQVLEDSRPILNLILGVVGALIMMGGPLLLLLLWYLRGRDPQVAIPIDYLTEPPSDAPPGVAGTLLDETADMQDILATLIDLARRGYLEIEEQTGRGLLVSSTDFAFRRTGKPADDLLPYESILLSKVAGRLGTQQLSALRNKFYTAIPKMQGGLYEEIVRRGYFRSNPETTRKMYSGTGITLLFLLGFGAFFTLSTLIEFTEAALCPVMGIGVFCVALIIVGRYMPAKTRKGAEEAARWAAFKRYLAEIERYTDLREATDQFERYLPYAIAFGIDRSWMKKFSRIETTPMPAWYILPIPVGGPYRGNVGGMLPKGGLTPSGGVPSLDGMSQGLGASLDRMSRGLGSMLDSAASTFVSQPRSSGGGGGWSGGGGGGGFR